MDKSILNYLGIGILVIIIISTTLSLTGLIPGKLGDSIITGSGLIIAIIIFILIKKKNLIKDKKF